LESQIGRQAAERPVARMKRSEIRGTFLPNGLTVPDCATLHPGYRLVPGVFANDQCDISVGTVILWSISRVTPPSSRSWRRECP
jgi:hypothetical protein